MVPIYVQEEGPDSLDRFMEVSRRISQEGLCYGYSNASLGLDFGKSNATLFSAANRSGPNSDWPSSSTTIGIRVSRFGSS